MIIKIFLILLEFKQIKIKFTHNLSSLPLDYLFFIYTLIDHHIT